MNIYEFSKKITTKKDFEQFLSYLIEDFKNNRSTWDNDKIETFLDGALRFTESIDNYYRNMNESVDTTTPSWKLIADILLAAKVYE